jgi:hypothetical protein
MAPLLRHRPSEGLRPFAAISLGEHRIAVPEGPVEVSIGANLGLVTAKALAFDSSLGTYDEEVRVFSNGQALDRRAPEPTRSSQVSLSP